MVIRMELFDNNKQQGVRLRSHLDKYLVADDDQQSTRQSRNGKARRARWVVELVDRKPGFIRLKSCYGHYLSASNHPFLLGFTGKRVVQSQPESITDLKIEWRPIRDGFQVKLVAYDGSYLRANGGTPPWRNTITHDVPQASTSTKNWILWEVEAVEVPENEKLTDYLSLVTSFSSVTDELSSLDLGSPMSTHSGFGSPRLLTTKSSLPEPEVKKITAMEVFRNAKAVRLQSVQNKYLIAEDDEVSVSQSRNGSAKSAKWTVELVENSDDINIIRLKSCYNKYLTASNQAFLLGMTGKKVLQTIPNRVDSSVEWEPVKEGNRIKLKTRYGHFLRANGGLKPWKNSVTHDIPHRTATQDWVLWEVHVVEFVAQSPAAAAVSNEPVVQHSGSFTSETSTPSSLSSKSASFSGLEFGDSMVDSAAQHKVPPGEGNGNGNGNGNGRRIYYQMADEYGEVEEEEGERCSITFKGNSVEELTKKLEVETGLDDIQVCTRSPLNGKLYPLRLHLPPNNAPFNVVIFQSSPKVARAMPVILLPRNI